MDNNQITLNIIKKSKKNLTAYQILDRFKNIKKVQPMTVYRSLDYLIKKGIIHKENHNKTYMICSHINHENHSTLIAICKKCGKTKELVKEVFSPIIKISKLKEFDLSFFNLEILTKCKGCK